jgi:hypothetical protein
MAPSKALPEKTGGHLPSGLVLMVRNGFFIPA